MKKILKLSIVLFVFVVNTCYSQSTTTLRSDGTILVNGQAYFPNGIYLVSYGLTTTQALQYLSEIKNAGFNTVIAAYDATFNFGTFLDSANTKGIHVIVDGIGTGSTALINQYKVYPAVIGFVAADDVHAIQGMTPSKFRTANTQMKNAATNCLTLSTGYDTTAYGPYIGISDLNGLYSYPISNGNVLHQVDAFMNFERKYNKTNIAIPQAFNWQFNSSSRAPTALEYRNMAYQHFINNFKAYLPYTYYDNVNYLPNYSALWTEVKATIPEVNTLAPVFMDGTYYRANTGVTPGLAGVQGAYWIYNGFVYIIVVNTSSSNSGTVNIQLPSGTSGSAQSLFSRLPNTLSFNAGILTGNIGTSVVEVYKLPYSAPSATVVNFEDRPSTETTLNGVYANIDWGSNQWATYTSTLTSPVSKVLEMYTNATTQTTMTFTLPAGKKLKSLDIALDGNASTKSVVISSTGNPTLTWTDMTTTFKTYTTNWTVAAPTITVKVTCNLGASYIVFDNVTYDAAIGAQLIASFPQSQESAELGIGKFNNLIYPNPIKNGFVNVDISNFTEGENLTLNIYDLSGKTVLSKKLNKTANVLKVSFSERAGLYLLMLESKNKKITQKLLVE